MTQPRPFEDMSSIEPGVETGVLWAINRYIFHPRGFALAFHFDDNRRLTGWSVFGDGTKEVWAYESESDDDGFRKFEAFLASLRCEQPSVSAKTRRCDYEEKSFPADQFKPVDGGLFEHLDVDPKHLTNGLEVYP